MATFKLFLLILLSFLLLSCGDTQEYTISIDQISPEDQISHSDWTLEEIDVDNMMLNVWILTDEENQKQWIIVRGYSVGGVSMVERNPKIKMGYTPTL